MICQATHSLSSATSAIPTPLAPSRAVQDRINTMRRQNALREVIAASVHLPLGLVESICDHQHKVAQGGVCLTYYGERRAKPGEVVRCRGCGAKLTVILPGYECAACELKEKLRVQRGQRKRA